MRAFLFYLNYGFFYHSLKNKQPVQRKRRRRLEPSRSQQPSERLIIRCHLWVMRIDVTSDSEAHLRFA